MRCMRKCAAVTRGGIVFTRSKKRRRIPRHLWKPANRVCARASRDSMDLLLTHGYFLGEDPKEQEIMKPYAPLGLLYLSSHLRGRGFDVEIYDSTFGSREDLFRVIETERPAAVGVYGNLMPRRNVLAIAAAARACGSRVVL